MADDMGTATRTVERDGAAPAEQLAAVLTSREVLGGRRPALLVARDVDDRWRVLSGYEHTRAVGGTGTDRTTAHRVTELVATDWDQLLAIDPTLGQVHGLGRGWVAHRDTPSAPWRRSPG